jgi:radical SAM protein with 4Fe4S-binding SPASM domain
LHCRNCSNNSASRSEAPELSTEEGLALINDLAALKVPRLIFAGGEPLLRPDLLDLVASARKQNLKSGLATDGTLLTLGNDAELRGAGLNSVGILLERLGPGVDVHRGTPGAYQAVLEAFANCQAAGLEAEIRVPLTRWNYPELPAMLDLIEARQIRRVVFTHLIYGMFGYGIEDDTTHAEKRLALDLIFDRAEDFNRRGLNIAIATDGNHADAIYFYLRMMRANPASAAALYPSLRAMSADVQGAGVGIAGISANGDVHADPYWTNSVLGNVRETPFSEIWGKSTDPLLQGLRNRLPLLKGKCAKCRWKQACGGNVRVRAEKFFGDPWMTDPACYLTSNEIGKEIADPLEAMEDDVLLEEQAA